MLIQLLLILTGLVLLPLAADWLVRGSTSLARRIHVSELLIGLTVVAVGTSAPELVTGVIAAVKSAPGIVLGNAVGSNIANLGLVLGGVALLGRIPVQRRLLGPDLWAMLGITALAMVLALGGVISRWEGLLLVLCLGGLTAWAIRRGRVRPPQPEALEPEPQLAVWLEVSLLVLGLAGLVVGADLLVRGSTAVAALWGVSNTVIGATVVAVGTSLPELAASFAAARRKSYGIMLGNLVGSCQFNLAAITGIPALITPLKVDQAMLHLHLPVLALVSVVAWAAIAGDGIVKRREGLILLVLYVCYVAATLWLA